MTEDLDVVRASVPDSDEDEDEDEDLVDDLIVEEERDGDEADDDVDQLEGGEQEGRLLTERIQSFAFLQKS